MIISLDIETESLTADKDDALSPFKSSIILVGLYGKYKTGKEFRKILRDRTDLSTTLCELLQQDKLELVGHNLKFDLKHLWFQWDMDLRELWAHDTQIMAQILTEKIPCDWLENYEHQRRERSKLLPPGISHRTSGRHGLKTLAPYFLGVEPFWENPADHNNEIYCLQDCEYTYRLYLMLKDKLETEKSLDFYSSFAMPSARMLLGAELTGIKIDEPLLKISEEESYNNKESLAQQIKKNWSSYFEEYSNKLRTITGKKYSEMMQNALTKVDDISEQRRVSIVNRYNELEQKAIKKIPPFNLDSSSQMLWLLKEKLNLDVEGWNGKESTGRPVLEKLAADRDDIKTYLAYRKEVKLLSAFYPSYKEKLNNGLIHCNFNPQGARTGRLSSSDPNLQQVPSHLHKLFIARPEHLLITRDMAAIEPRLIAYYTEDRNLFKIFDEELDFHGYNAVVFFGLSCSPNEVKELFPLERKIAKEVGLALFYGAGANRIKISAQKHGVMWSLEESKRKFDRFKKAYSTVFRFKEDLDSRLNSGAIMRNFFGRPFSFSQEDVYMKGFNTLIQSSASDLVLASAMKISSHLGHTKEGVRLLVHDELVIEIDQSDVARKIELIEKCMTNFDLPTSLGTVKLKVEGNEDICWRK